MMLVSRLCVCLTALAVFFTLVTGAGAQAAEPTAMDGQRLSSQPADTQALFGAVFGDAAAKQWAKEHSTGLIKAQGAMLGIPVTGTTVIPDAPAVPADTTKVKQTWTKDNAPLTGDLIDIDQQAHLLYVGNAAANAIEVFDVSQPTPKWVKAIRMPKGAAGILVAPDINKVFAGNPNGLVIVDVDPNSETNGTVLATLSIGPGGTDELDYDPVHHKVYVTDVPDRRIGVVDAVNNTILKTFTNLPEAQVEQPRFNPADGFIYVAWRVTNQIAKFDPATDELVSTTPIGVPCTPSGVAIKPTTGIAMLGCRAEPQTIVFWDLNKNALVAAEPHAGGADQVIYDATSDRFFAANSRFHRGAVVSMYDGDGNFITNVPTTFASHQVGYDHSNRVVYTLGGGLVSFTIPF